MRLRILILVAAVTVSAAGLERPAPDLLRWNLPFAVGRDAPLEVVSSSSPYKRRLAHPLDPHIAEQRSYWLQYEGLQTNSHNKRTQRGRKMLAGFSSNDFQVLYSSTTAVCPSTTGDWAEIPTYGNLVSDNWVCDSPPSQVYGAAAQDFRDLPSLETYGWAAFKVPPRPDGSNAATARVEGLNLHVIGHVGPGSVGNCSVEAVDMAIYTDSNGAPGSLQYDAVLRLPGRAPGAGTFVWSSSSSAVLSFDIVNLNPDNTANPTSVHLPFDATYWLRVKMLAPYTGASGTAKCFVFWAVSGASKTGNLCLWQEKGGGYSTLCKGAAANAIPAATQVWHF